jgi:hypothetical protein
LVADLRLRFRAREARPAAGREGCVNLPNTIRIELDHTQERFKAYVSAIARLRWFLLASTLLASSLLLHVYIEQFSFQESQMIGYLAQQRERATEIAERQQHLDSRQDKKSAAYRQEALELAGLRHVTGRTENTLAADVVKDRTLPLIGLPIPANDYLPVMFVMITLFAVAVWLNIRSIDAAVHEIDRARELPAIADLLRLHFTFTGLLDSEGGQTMGKVLQVCALLLPFVAMAIAMVLDLFSAFNIYNDSSNGYAGSLGLIFLRGLALLVMIVTTGLATQASIFKARELDKVIFRKQMVSPPASR